MIMSSRVFDLNSTGKMFRTNPNPFNAVVASLSMADFTSKQISAANTVGEAIDLPQCRSLMGHVVVTAKGSALAGGAVKLQGSLVGGDQANAWFDITASVNVTAVEDSEQHLLTLSATYAPAQFKFVRLHATVTPGANSTFDMYAILHTRNDN
jgi:hypothetical protein